MKVHKITEEYYDEVKRSLNSTWKWTRFTKRHIQDVAYRHGISYKTVVQIKASRTYAEYQEQVKAQHPETIYSLREDVLALHKTVFDKNDNTYKAPRSAKTAVTQLNYELAKRK